MRTCSHKNEHEKALIIILCQQRLENGISPQPSLRYFPHISLKLTSVISHSIFPSLPSNPTTNPYPHHPATPQPYASHPSICADEQSLTTYFFPKQNKRSMLKLIGVTLRRVLCVGTNRSTSFHVFTCQLL